MTRLVQTCNSTKVLMASTDDNSKDDMIFQNLKAIPIIFPSSCTVNQWLAFLSLIFFVTSY